MSRPEITFERDMTFHVARREYGYNAPATDLDFLEYDNFEPILLWEAKSFRSGWRNGIRTAGIRAQWKLAKRADIPYVVVEHNDIWSKIIVCKINGWELAKPTIASEQKMSLKQFVSWLYEIRGRNIEHELGHELLKRNWVNIVPDELEPVVFRKDRD